MTSLSNRHRNDRALRTGDGPGLRRGSANDSADLVVSLVRAEATT
ncbi:hypothetical protein SAMN04489713_12563 [Actinomadura madurae]|uniref:Uncharacterized protein n=1 Tax=Actinomadura madurae TaxID=1993 RepID=A0A1I5X0P9_9ACTN|nr:hypothetical protein SAMN04489713_12563 [Actinomadura madurae]